MAVLSYRTLASVLDSREQLNAETQKWRDCAIFFARLEQDFSALLDRPVRSADDTVLPALVINPDTNADTLLSFTRSGYAQAEGLLAAPQRVGYRLHDGRIELMLWPHPDAAPRTTPQPYNALENVTDFSLRALDLRGNWQPRWPVPAIAGSNTETFPAALEARITLRSGETITRLFALGGAP
jgi:general secretion pathway protein J